MHRHMHILCVSVDFSLVRIFNCRKVTMKMWSILYAQFLQGLTFTIISQTCLFQQKCHKINCVLLIVVVPIIKNKVKAIIWSGNCHKMLTWRHLFHESDTFEKWDKMRKTKPCFWFFASVVADENFFSLIYRNTILFNVFWLLVHISMGCEHQTYVKFFSTLISLWQCQ